MKTRKLGNNNLEVSTLGFDRNGLTFGCASSIPKNDVIVIA
jgi:hypothetical protein